MAATGATHQLACPFRSSRRGPSVLRQAAELAESRKMHLAVVVPLVLSADGPGCCGIRGRRWHDMLRRVAEEDADEAKRVLVGAGISHSVTIVEGSSVPAILGAFVSCGERELVLPDKPSGTVFTRSTLRRTKRLGGRVLGLPSRS